MRNMPNPGHDVNFRSANQPFFYNKGVRLTNLDSILDSEMTPMLHEKKKIEREAATMIDTYEAGRLIRIDGRTYHSDVKIIGDEVRANWWRKAGHRLDRVDISDILEKRPDILVVGTGYAGMMQVPDATREALADQGIHMRVEKTDSAVRVFNRLHKEGRKVAGAFHLTC
jgi:hypothetical protein